MPRLKGKNYPPRKPPALGGQAGAKGGGGWAPGPKYEIEASNISYFGPSHLYEVMVKVLEGYEVKEELKRLGYKWNKPTKAWYKIVNIKNLPSEINKLEEIGVKPVTPDYKASVARKIHAVMRSVLRRVGWEYGFKEVEDGCCKFILEPIKYTLKLKEAAASDPSKKKRLEENISKMLEYLKKFAEVQYDPDTLKITVAHPNPPTTSQQ